VIDGCEVHRRRVHDGGDSSHTELCDEVAGAWRDQQGVASEDAVNKSFTPRSGAVTARSSLSPLLPDPIERSPSLPRTLALTCVLLLVRSRCLVCGVRMQVWARSDG
jgi:hypothetical protein